MKTLTTLTEAASSADQVLLPNRYQTPFTDAFEELTGVEVPEMQGRKMSAVSGGIKFRWLRGRDIPRVTDLANGADPAIRTIGLTGSEWCLEYLAMVKDKAMVDWQKIGGRLGTISVIASADAEVAQMSARLDRGFEPLRVATAYPNLVSTLGLSGRFNIAPEVTVQGCVEGAADTLGLAAVDLVSTGETLKENDFVVVADLFESFPALVTPKPRSEGINI